jgi:LmbE family N-acetylglucosaminyl deacetylase
MSHGERVNEKEFVPVGQARLLLVRVLCIALVVGQSSGVPAAAQQGTAGGLAQANKQPDTGVLPQDSGTLGLQNMLRKLHTTARLLQTTAHPDDEDGGMLAYESRFKGADVMLLTLTRGDGGQNKTGSNFFDELGVLRTLELLESGKYYGVKQRFSRVADFGFSKSATETFEKWGGKEVPLAEMVRVIRTFRPDVVAARFSGTPRDGHGHHQASGILTPEAVRAAADPNRFPEQIREGLLPWRVKKVYMGLRGPDDYSVRIDAGQNYPPLGMSFAQFGIEGYSHQKSQNAQVFQIPPGPSYRNYKLVDSALGPIAAGTHENDFFDGIDTSIPGLADFDNALWDENYHGQIDRAAIQKELEKIAKKVDEATEAAKTDPVKAAVILLAGKRLTTQLLQNLDLHMVASSKLNSDSAVRMRDRLEEKEQQFQDAANLALGLKLEAYMTEAGSQKTVIPGQAFLLHVQSKAPPAVKSEEVEVLAWRIKPVDASAQSWDLRVTVPPTSSYTRPYWHRKDPERDNVYTVDNPIFSNLPLTPAPEAVRLHYKVGGEEGSIASPIKASAADPRRDLAVVPPFSVLLEHAAHVVPTTSRAPLEVKVEVQKNFIGRAKAAVRLNVPAGWKVSPASQAADFGSAADSKSVSFTVTPGTLREGNYELSAAVDYNGKTYHEGFSVVGRDDLDTFYYYQPANQRVSAVDVKVPANLRIGYVMGAGDDIPPVLEHLGMQIKQLTPEDVEHGDLSKFDTIVLGIRAYDTREDVRKNNKRFLDFAANGGTLIVQNNFSTDDFNKGNYTPYPAQLSRERVSVEEAPVQILAPDDSIFHYPNAITAHDFDGWVQERGVNFMTTWDDHFQPLLASGDPGETPLKGGMLRARFGKGTYIYTGYAFFRQLPAGVPGAVRLYVNLVSAGHEPAK